MSNLPAIDVAIATLDRPAQLARAIAAIASGEILPARLIVVDQSADDHSRRVAAALAQRLPICYVHSTRRGLARGKNIALAEATAPFLAFTDDDCVADSAWLAAFARALGQPGA